MSHHKKRKHQNLEHLYTKPEEQSYNFENQPRRLNFNLSTEKKVIIGIIIFTLFILGGSIFVLNSGESAQAITMTQEAKADIAEKQFDWGNIDYDGPKATKIFTIKNSGTKPLQLTKIKTSCHCTTAQLSIDNNKSPLFGMNASAPWVGTVAPGKEAQLEVVFDQTFHGPSGIGLVERFVSVETNDAAQPKIDFSLAGIVIKS